MNWFKKLFGIKPKPTEQSTLIRSTQKYTTPTTFYRNRYRSEPLSPNNDILDVTNPLSPLNPLSPISIWDNDNSSSNDLNSDDYNSSDNNNSSYDSSSDSSYDSSCDSSSSDF